MLPVFQCEALVLIRQLSPCPTFARASRQPQKYLPVRPANDEPSLRHCAHPAQCPSNGSLVRRSWARCISLSARIIIGDAGSVASPSSWSSLVALVLVSSTTNVALVGVGVGGADTVEPVASAGYHVDNMDDVALG
jgi:hypothetical protein